MKGKWRRMQKYTPRKTAGSKALNKQQLHDLELKLSTDINSYLVLNEEGSAQQAEHARVKAKSDLLKFGPDMKKISQEIGGNLPVAVDSFLSSIDSIVHAHNGFLDEQRISDCYKATENLEREIAM